MLGLFLLKVLLGTIIFYVTCGLCFGIIIMLWEHLSYLCKFNICIKIEL